MPRLIVWTVGLAITLACVGGGAAYWVYQERDALLEAEILKQLSTMCPDARFTLGRARFDWSNRVEVYQLTVTLPEDSTPALVIPQATIAIDVDTLADEQRVVIRQIHVHQPWLRVRQFADGNWDWAGLSIVKREAALLPELRINRGRLLVELERPVGPQGELSWLPLNCERVNVTAVPAARQSYRAEVQCEPELLGPIKATGLVHLDNPRVEGDVALERLAVGPELLTKVAELYPPLQPLVEQAEARLLRMLAPVKPPATVNEAVADTRSVSGRVPAPSAAAPETPATVPAQRFPDYGVRGEVATRFHGGWSKDSGLTEWSIKAQVAHGQVLHPALPLPVFDLAGEIAASPREVKLTKCSGSTSAGAFSLQLVAPLGRMWSGEAAAVELPGRDVEISNDPRDRAGEHSITDARPEPGHGSPRTRSRTELESVIREPNATQADDTAELGQGTLIARSWELTDRLRDRLPAPLRKICNELSLTGVFDAHVDFQQRRSGEWKPHVRLDGRDCAFAHERFPYPVKHAAGVVHVNLERLDLDVQGMAGEVPVRITGVGFSPGPGMEANFEIRAQDAPVDRLLVTSCPPSIQRVLQALRLEGRVDVVVRLQRALGLGHKIEPLIAARVRKGVINYDGFPVRITEIEGTVLITSESFTFRELRGRHEDAEIVASGEYLRFPAPGRLELTIDATNAAFNGPLRAALPKYLKEVWDEFQPRGRFHTVTRVGWSPGRAPDVTVPRFELSSADFVMKSFPHPFYEAEGRFAYAEGQLSIHGFRARHDDTLLQLSGTGHCTPGPWSLDLDSFRVDDLAMSPSLRRALPDGLRQVADVLQPTGTISATGRVRAYQAAEDPADREVGWEWDLGLVLAGNDLTAGTRVEDIHGRLQLRGQHRSGETDLRGDLDLDTANVYQHQFTAVKGPFRLERQQLTWGAIAALEPGGDDSPVRNLPLEDRISAKAINGVVTLDGSADLNAGPRYRLISTLSRGDLEQYSLRYLRGQSHLRGIMNGWIELQGVGMSDDAVQGRGQLQISPAALYELPIFVQMFRLPQLGANDRTAFTYADLNYDVAESRFNFRRIDLVGAAMSMRGRGYVRFDGPMNLEFYTMAPRNQVRFPILNEVVGLLSRGWMGVHVTGTVGNPHAEMVAVPELNNALRDFLDQFDTRPRRLDTTDRSPLEPPR